MRKNNGLEKRAAQAQSKAASAATVFERAAAEFQEAALLQAAVAADAQAEINRLLALRDEAEKQSVANEAAAVKVRELLGQ